MTSSQTVLAPSKERRWLIDFPEQIPTNKKAEMITGEVRMGTVKRTFMAERTKGVRHQFLITEEENGRIKPKILLGNKRISENCNGWV